MQLVEVALICYTWFHVWTWTTTCGNQHHEDSWHLPNDIRTMIDGNWNDRHPSCQRFGWPQNNPIYCCKLVNMLVNHLPKNGKIALADQMPNQAMKLRRNPLSIPSNARSDPNIARISNNIGGWTPSFYWSDNCIRKSFVHFIFLHRPEWCNHMETK